ncbi:SigB/SigF/SigG family RNA polymerase sigma factor [Nocardia sp. NBC_01377]|uniref:SigB/SigF/SigG family RNA polymerase sigma factor n=1 Tax=Nocardia sp. NBC_01377 TaxID=2903595 RepID=UPI003246AB67
MTEYPNTTSSSPRGSGDSYDDIEPRFDELGALDESDPRRRVIREEIMRRCLPLAQNIARKFRGRGIDDDDLRQVAYLGLVGAVDRFDPSHGSSFLSFAVPTIMGEVRRHFRDQSWSVRVPRGTKEVHAKIGPATEMPAQRLGRMPRPSGIAAELDLDRGEVTHALVAANAYRADSLDTPFHDENGEGDNPVVARMGAEDTSYRQLEDAMTVRPLLEALPAEQRQLLVWRFSENLSRSEIAERLDVSQMQVSRKLTRLFTQLREQALADPDIEQKPATVTHIRRRVA